MTDKEIIKEFIHYIKDDDYYNSLLEVDKIKYESLISNTIAFSIFKLRREVDNLCIEILSKLK